jgi:hypothetical protein
MDPSNNQSRRAQAARGFHQEEEASEPADTSESIEETITAVLDRTIPKLQGPVRLQKGDVGDACNMSWILAGCVGRENAKEVLSLYALLGYRLCQFFVHEELEGNLPEPSSGNYSHMDEVVEKIDGVGQISFYIIRDFLDRKDHLDDLHLAYINRVYSKLFRLRLERKIDHVEFRHQINAMGSDEYFEGMDDIYSECESLDSICILESSLNTVLAKERASDEQDLKILFHAGEFTRSFPTAIQKETDSSREITEVAADAIVNRLLTINQLLTLYLEETLSSESANAGDKITRLKICNELDANAQTVHGIIREFLVAKKPKAELDQAVLDRGIAQVCLSWIQGNLSYNRFLARFKELRSMGHFEDDFDSLLKYSQEFDERIQVKVH